MQKLTRDQEMGAHGTCDTVTVETEAGPVRINAHEFDKEKHKLYVEPKAETAKAKK